MAWSDHHIIGGLLIVKNKRPLKVPYPCQYYFI